jgi:hypothetical protein
LSLYGRWRNVSLSFGRLFFWPRASTDSALTSVVAHVVHRDVIDDDRLVIDIPHVRHVVYGSVVEKGSVVPISAVIADTTVAEAVINAAVESDMRTPVALMKNEDAIAPWRYCFRGSRPGCRENSSCERSGSRLPRGFRRHCGLEPTRRKTRCSRAPMANIARQHAPAQPTATRRGVRLTGLEDASFRHW